MGCSVPAKLGSNQPYLAILFESSLLTQSSSFASSHTALPARPPDTPGCSWAVWVVPILRCLVSFESAIPCLDFNVTGTPTRGHRKRRRAERTTTGAAITSVEEDWGVAQLPFLPRQNSRVRGRYPYPVLSMDKIPSPLRGPNPDRWAVDKYVSYTVLLCMGQGQISGCLFNTSRQSGRVAA